MINLAEDPRVSANLYTRPRRPDDGTEYYHRLIGVMASFRHLLDDLDAVVAVDGETHPILYHIEEDIRQVAADYSAAMGSRIMHMSS